MKTSEVFYHAFVGATAGGMGLGTLTAFIPARLAHIDKPMMMSLSDLHGRSNDDGIDKPMAMALTNQ